MEEKYTPIRELPDGEFGGFNLKSVDIEISRKRGNMYDSQMHPIYTPRSGCPPLQSMVKYRHSGGGWARDLD